MKKQIAFLLMLLLLISSFTSIINVSANTEKKVTSLDGIELETLHLNTGEEIYRIDPSDVEEVKQYLLTGDVNALSGDVSLNAVSVTLVSVGRYVFKKAVDVFLVSTFEAAYEKAKGWIQTDIMKVTEKKATNIKVLNTSFDPNLKSTHVCDSCANSVTYVSLLQRALNSIPIDSGKADGKWGPKTKAAAREFQRIAGLTVDGHVGPATWRQLAIQTS